MRHSYPVTADDRVAAEVEGRIDPGCRFAKADAAHRCSRRDGADLEPGMPCYREAFEQVREAGQTLREAEIAADGGIDEPVEWELPPPTALQSSPLNRLGQAGGIGINHDERCEAEWESGAMAYTVCGCVHRASETTDGGIDEPGMSDLCRPPYVATEYGPVYRLIDLADPREV